MRIIKAPQRLGYADMISYAFVAAREVDEMEPIDYEQAVNSKESSKWIAAMEEDMASLYKNNTWNLVDKPPNQKLVGCKWIFKKKEGSQGREAVRYKARLVAKGFTQREGVDFNEIFSPVIKHTSIRIILSMVAQLDKELDQMNVKTTFLYGELEETIYMRQSDGFEQGNPYVLTKSLPVSKFRNNLNSVKVGEP